MSSQPILPLINGLLSQVPDIDKEETSEWIESIDGLIDSQGGPRARYLLMAMERRARERGVRLPHDIVTPYVNTIGIHDEPYYPGDEKLEREYRRWIRWNAAVMVTRQQRPGVGVGGQQRLQGTGRRRGQGGQGLPDQRRNV